MLGLHFYYLLIIFRIFADVSLAFRGGREGQENSLMKTVRSLIFKFY